MHPPHPWGLWAQRGTIPGPVCKELGLSVEVEVHSGCKRKGEGSLLEGL